MSQKPPAPDQGEFSGSWMFQFYEWVKGQLENFISVFATVDFVVGTSTTFLGAERVATDTASIDADISTAGQIKFVVLPAGVDHGGLAGLADDDHTQYALLAGRSGGQSLLGGTASGNSLTLQSTSNATKGGLLLGTDDFIRFDEHASAPGTPASGNVVLYAKADGHMYQKDDAGTETDLAAAGGSGLTLGTEQASTSGTAITFTGIPAGTKRIIVSLYGVSTNGTSAMKLQIGDSGGIETAGYVGGTVINLAASNVLVAFPSGAGFDFITAQAAVATYHATLTLTLVDSANNQWSCVGGCNRNDSVTYFHVAGDKALSAVLTQLTITTLSADTFDAGAINIAYL